MSTFREYINEEALDTKIGMLAYMLAYHGLDASYVNRHISESRYLEAVPISPQLAADLAQPPPQQPPPVPNQQQQPQGWAGRWGQRLGQMGNWMYNNPVKTAGIVGTAINPAFGPMAMAGTWMAKKAYNWYQNRNKPGQQPDGQAGGQQQTGQQQPDNKVGQMAGQILPQLQQLKSAVGNDPKGQQAVDALLQYLGSAQQGAPAAAPTGQQSTGGLQADKATTGT